MKKILIIIVIVAIALIAWMVLKPKTTTAPGNTTAQDKALEAELSAVDHGDLESDFKDIDKDLQTL